LWIGVNELAFFLNNAKAECLKTAHHHTSPHITSLWA